MGTGYRVDGSAKVDLGSLLQHRRGVRAQWTVESKPLGVGTYLSLCALQAAADHCMAWPVQHPTELLAQFECSGTH